MKNVTVKVGGRTVRIPEMWLVGATHFGRSLQDAIRLWLEQEAMAKEFEAQK